MPANPLDRVDPASAPQARRWRDEDGPTTAEYLMFGALVALVVVMAAAIVSSALTG